MRSIFSALVLSVVLLVGACQGSTSSNGGKGYKKFEKACVVALKKRLKSPSSFKLESVTNLTQVMTFSEQEAQEIRRRFEELYAKEKSGETLTPEENLEFLSSSLKLNAAEHGGGVSFLVVIEYDAQNSYGASLRDKSICSHDSYGGEFGEYDDEDDVLIDGQKH